MPIARQKNSSPEKEIKALIKKKKTAKASDAQKTAKKTVRQKTKKTGVKVKKKTVKVGRKSDGTFSEGNSFGKNSGGRPKNDFSYRAMAKKMAAENPERIAKDLKILSNIIDSETSSPMEKMKALELLIKLNGNFDPQETKDVSEKEIVNPFENLTEAELRKLAK